LNRDATETGHHRSVLLAETLAVLEPCPGKVFLDGTLGDGGHTGALLERGASVVALDRDPDALARASARLANYGGQLSVRHANFADMGSAAPELFDGILLDLGVSSFQLDTAGRGFSFRLDGPLDMRMNPLAGMPISALLDSVGEEEIVVWLREYGEEPRARAVARAILRERRAGRLGSTAELAALVESVCSGAWRRGHHPATRTFQALRMAVNDELGSLEKGLESSADRLKPGGVLAVITFHSLEDRMVKHFMRRTGTQWMETPEWPESVPNPEWLFEAVTRKGVQASDGEIEANPRARSARLRAVRRRPFPAGKVVL